MTERIYNIITKPQRTFLTAPFVNTLEWRHSHAGIGFYCDAVCLYIPPTGQKMPSSHPPPLQPVTPLAFNQPLRYLTSTYDPRSSRSTRRYSQWDGRSAYPQDRRFVDDQDFNSARGLGNMSRCEREEVWRRAQARINDPYSMPRQRSGAYATMGNFHAAEDVHDRRRRRNTGVDEVSEHMARIGLGGREPRDRHSGRGIRWVDQSPAPEPPRIMHPRDVEYALNRAYRHQHSYHDNYNDAYQYMYGRQPGHRTAPDGGRHNPREYADLIPRFGLNGRRNRDPATSRWDRFRNWW